MMQGRGEPSDAGHLSATHVSRASRARPASRALVGVDEKLPGARRVLVGNTAHAQLRARLAVTHGAHDAINHVPGHPLYAEGLLVLVLLRSRIILLLLRSRIIASGSA